MRIVQTKPAPREWLEVLYRSSDVRAVQRLLVREPADLTTALEALEETADWSLLPRILPLAFGRHPKIAGHASTALTRLLALVPVSRLPGLDREVRQEPGRCGYTPTFSSWLELTPEAVKGSAGSMAPTLVGLCSFHPNGRVRAAALSALRKHHPGDALAFYLLRLADWVPILRHQAQELSAATLVPGNERAWCKGAALLEAVERSTRSSTTSLKAAVAQHLDSEAGHAALREALRSSDRDVRFLAFRRLLEAQVESPGLVAAALVDEDTRIAGFAVERLASRTVTPTLAPALLQGLHSGHHLVRRHCLDAYANLLGAAAAPAVLAGLRDRSGVVRGVAQFHARRLGVVGDLVELYRDLLQARAPSHVAAGIAGLAALNARSSWPGIKPYLWARQPNLRRAALRCAVELEVADVDAYLWDALGDEHRAVTNLARRLLSRSSTHPPDALKAVRLAVSANRPEPTRLNALGLIRRAPKWQQAIALLRVARATSGPVKAFAIYALEQWDRSFNAQFARPSPDEISVLSAELARAREAIPERLLQSVSLSLKPWGAS